MNNNQTAFALTTPCQDLTNVQSIYRAKLKTVTLKLDPAHVCDISKPFVTAPVDVEPILRSIYDGLEPDQEHFTMLALNTHNWVIGYKILFTGGQCSSVVDPRVVFRNALLIGASSIIVAHNHPSGNTTPSKEDISISRLLVESGKMLGIPLNDHMILTASEMVSLAEKGYV